ncbi:MAG: HAD-IA family hydrolase [Alistipes sp.]|nr:HAD-IA family hydrolase [Alistipes sp.]
MSDYKIYLFDFDYTLADSSAGIVKCFQLVLNDNGFTHITDGAIKHTIGKTLEDSFSALTGVTDSGELRRLKDQYIGQANLYMTPNTRLFPETGIVLSELKNRGARLGIISTKHRYTITELLERDFPPGVFDIVIGCEDVREAKPSPEGLKKALAYLNGNREDTLYIGDSIIDARLAEVAGVDFYGVLHGTTIREELEVFPHKGIGNDLTGLLNIRI